MGHGIFSQQQRSPTEHNAAYFLYGYSVFLLPE